MAVCVPKYRTNCVISNLHILNIYNVRSTKQIVVKHEDIGRRGAFINLGFKVGKDGVRPIIWKGWNGIVLCRVK